MMWGGMAMPVPADGAALLWPGLGRASRGQGQAWSGGTTQAILTVDEAPGCRGEVCTAESVWCTV